MWLPGQKASREIVEAVVAALNDEQVRAELSKRIRIEMDTQRPKYDGYVQSYESLTSGNVNMQARMAASGYDVYGRTIVTSNKPKTNVYAHQNMKNKIRYGRAPQDGFKNRGGFSVT